MRLLGDLRLVSSSSVISETRALMLQRQQIRARLASGGLVWAALGDSTETGGGIYGQVETDRLSGWPNLAAYDLIRSDPAFVALPASAYTVTPAYVSSTLALAFPSWQATKSASPTIGGFYVENPARATRDRFTCYLNERTSNAAATFRLTVRQEVAGATVYQDALDTYAAPVTFAGGVPAQNVVGRIAKRTVTLASTTRNATVTIDTFDTLDRGSGVAANGTAAIYGFSCGTGVGFHNLAVSSSTLTSPSAANTTRGVTTEGQLALATAAGANLYTIGWATNDSKDGVTTLAAFRSDYESFIDAIFAADPSAVVIPTTAPRGLADPYDANPEYNAVVRSIAQRRRLLCLDVEALSDSLGSPFYADDIHPSSEGIYQTAKAFGELIGL